MGKIKKSRQKRSQDIVPENVEEESLEINQPASENVVQTVLDQLQSVNVEEKYCGLQTLGLFIENPDNIEEVFRKEVVKSVAPLLLDPAGSVRNAAAGTLRNLSVVGSQACLALMDFDIMTPLVAYFHQYAENWVPQDIKSNQGIEDNDTFVQCVNLLWNLCESSELAVKYLNESNILLILSKTLDISTFGLEVVIATLQCFFVVVEENPIAIEKVKANAEEALHKLFLLDESEPAFLLIKTLAIGVAINICGGNIASLPPEIITRMMSILGHTLSVDHRLACNQLSSSVPLSNGSGKVKALQGKQAFSLDSQIKNASHLLDAQQCSVEIITNLCSSEDDESQMEDEDSDYEENEDNISNDGSGSGDVSILPEDKLPAEMIEAMTSLELFQNVWHKTQLPAENVLLILKEYEGTENLIKKLQSLQSSALLCINNILSALPLQALGSIDTVYKIWIDTGKLVFRQQSSPALLESATAVMRAALDRLKSRECLTSGQNLFGDLALADIEMMVNGIRECEVPEIRSNLIRMIGTLALILTSSQSETGSSVVAAIAEFLLDQAHKETEAWVLAETLDTLVDMFSEDETDTLAAKIKLVDRLSALAPVLKNKARLQRKTLADHKVLVDTTTLNLPRFIQYKRKRITKIAS